MTDWLVQFKLAREGIKRFLDSCTDLYPTPEQLKILAIKRATALLVAESAIEQLQARIEDLESQLQERKDFDLETNAGDD